ncbi:hypothetical protein KCU76_g95, partial [Aureobasidium melanogenum]
MRAQILNSILSIWSTLPSWNARVGPTLGWRNLSAGVMRGMAMSKSETISSCSNKASGDTLKRYGSVTMSGILFLETSFQLLDGLYSALTFSIPSLSGGNVVMSGWRSASLRLSGRLVSKFRIRCICHQSLRFISAAKTVMPCRVFSRGSEENYAAERPSDCTDQIQNKCLQQFCCRNLHEVGINEALLGNIISLKHSSSLRDSTAARNTDESSAREGLDNRLTIGLTLSIGSP